MLDFDGTTYEKDGRERLLYTEAEKVQASFDGWSVKESTSEEAPAEPAPDEAPKTPEVPSVVSPSGFTVTPPARF